ncbi:hypothetical protein K438DRAFT_2013344, partial [Mycena galopus ATCC 62051]
SPLSARIRSFVPLFSILLASLLSPSITIRVALAVSRRFSLPVSVIPPCRSLDTFFARPPLPIRSSAGHALTLINKPLLSTRARPSPHPPSHTLPSILIPLQTFNTSRSLLSFISSSLPSHVADSLLPFQSRDEKNYSHVSVLNGGVQTRKEFCGQVSALSF